MGFINQLITGGARIVVLNRDWNSFDTETTNQYPQEKDE